MDEKEYRLPLGLCKQAALKIEAFNADIHEILEEEGLSDEEREIFKQMAEYSSVFLAHIVNIVHEECGEEDFISETFPMDELGQYPGDEEDLRDAEIN
ncbi:MAG: hypothetical protein NC489_11605 [Ruminococcus flavefaciens]|nr:hypothetical protein [Ruminococcus flavefaciens]